MLLTTAMEQIVNVTVLQVVQALLKCGVVLVECISMGIPDQFVAVSSDERLENTCGSHSVAKLTPRARLARQYR